MTAKPKPASKQAIGRTKPAARRAAPPPPTTKKAQLIALLRQKGGQNIAALGQALGWQAHTVRAALAGLRKAGHAVERVDGDDGVSHYHIDRGA